MTIRTLRQQSAKDDGEQPSLALSDFIAPEGIDDTIGGFACTAGIGLEDLVREFNDTGDDLVIVGVTHSMFARDYSPGTITLGGNGGGSRTSMYVVIITPSQN